MNALDVHAHVIVPEILRPSPGGESWRPLIDWRDGRQTVELEGHRIRSAIDPFSDVEAILERLAARRTGGVLLCPWVALLGDRLEPGSARECCGLQNLGLARLHQRHPDRVRVLGAVALSDPERAAADLVQIMATPGFAGVEVPASVAGEPLGHPRYEPFWSAAEAAGALVFVHPSTRAFSGAAFDDHHLWNVVGNPFETTLAAAHLVLSGTMVRHPRLRVLLAHAGGAVTALRGRLAHAQRTVDAAGPADAPPADRQVLERFLFDTVTHDAAALADLVGAVGPQRVMLGSDYPFDMADPDPVATVELAGLMPGDRRAVLWGNAARELGFPDRPPEPGNG